MSKIFFDETIDISTVPESSVQIIGAPALLGRDPHEIPEEVLNLFKGSVVLVTGAGGSVGGALVKKLAPVVSKLVLVDLHEPSLARAIQTVKTIAPETIVTPAIFDLKNEFALKNILREHTPAFVFHTAAFKHVDIAEENPAEAVHNNFLASALFASHCAEAGVKHFIFTSSDKAVLPKNILGASKRGVERYLLHMESAMHVSVVRFVNVLGSSGSVVKVFEKQINDNNHITVTDPHMERYLMSNTDAVYLTLSATAQTELYENKKQLYMLDPKQPVLVKDIAEKMITISGEDIEIVFTGVRPGEKIQEDLLYPYEAFEKTSYKDIFRIAFDAKSILKIENTAIANLSQCLKQGEYQAALKKFLEIVPEYKT